jgi:hypothetical protein
VGGGGWDLGVSGECGEEKVVFSEHVYSFRKFSYIFSTSLSTLIQSPIIGYASVDRKKKYIFCLVRMIMVCDLVPEYSKGGRGFPESCAIKT